MNNFDFENKKYVIYTGAIILFLFIMVFLAFDMVPTSETTSVQNKVELPSQITENVNKENMLQDAEEPEDVEEECVDDEDSRMQAYLRDLSEKQNQRLGNNISKKTKDHIIEEEMNETEKLIEIEKLEGDNGSLEAIEEDKSDLSQNQKVAIKLMEAYNLTKNGNKNDAINTYLNVIALTDDNGIKAICNENIAQIYAHMRKFGTAISYAKKAVNLEPSTMRSFLLVRLYYKTGNAEQATSAVLELLKKDF